MAVPPTATIKDMSGVYVLNKSLSDSSQVLLKMQGVGFIVRQAVQYSTITVTIKHYTDEDGKVHLDQKQVSTGGISNEDLRVLDWSWNENKNRIWGKVKGRNRVTKVSELDDEFLKEGWSEDCIEDGVIETVSESVTSGWVATQIFGFADVDGLRKQVRRVVGRKGDQVEQMRQVYDWKA
ncbi:hypothetical protein B0A55_00148 [Friedmanniomyces simplex]|uniref:Uncharacterized protein n=1 Tax=Friedmanniomyces simplex TaxID=329884 RepID=A0A4U0Y813_9PEZI|nr:hypothetical protein B0A55_00148 [Friedmanniomyces simplex]